MNFPASQFNYLQQMDLIIRMEMALAGDGNLVVHCLKQAIRQQRPARLPVQKARAVGAGKNRDWVQGPEPPEGRCRVAADRVAADSGAAGRLEQGAVREAGHSDAGDVAVPVGA